MGANFGCVLAVNGFSFIDTDGTYRQFYFLIDGFSGLVKIEEFALPEDYSPPKKMVSPGCNIQTTVYS